MWDLLCENKAQVFYTAQTSIVYLKEKKKLDFNNNYQNNIDLETFLDIKK